MEYHRYKVYITLTGEIDKSEDIVECLNFRFPDEVVGMTAVSIDDDDLDDIVE